LGFESLPGSSDCSQSRDASCRGGARNGPCIRAWAGRQALGGRFAEDDCEIDDDALSQLVALGGGHPRVSMLIAQQAHLLSIRLETRTITEVMVRQAYEAALDGDRAYLDQLLETVRSVNRHALRYLRRIASGAPLTKGIPPGDATRASRGLIAAGIIERAGRGSYEIVNPLFREYLLRDLP
jgi:hypothetical protein